MPLVSINQLADLCKVHRETVRKKLENIKFTVEGNGPKAAKLYESHVALPAILIPDLGTGDDSAISEAEARRRLTISKEKQIRLEMEVLNKERPKLKDVLEIFGSCMGDVAGIIKGSRLEPDRKDDILRRLQDSLNTLEAQAKTQEVAPEPTGEADAE